MKLLVDRRAGAKSSSGEPNATIWRRCCHGTGKQNVPVRPAPSAPSSGEPRQVGVAAFVSVGGGLRQRVTDQRIIGGSVDQREMERQCHGAVGRCGVDVDALFDLGLPVIFVDLADQAIVVQRFPGTTLRDPDLRAGRAQLLGAGEVAIEPDQHDVFVVLEVGIDRVGDRAAAGVPTMKILSLLESWIFLIASAKPCLFSFLKTLTACRHPRARPDRGNCRIARPSSAFQRSPSML